MLPKHIGFIMDGNGRWAAENGLQRSDGYAAGLLALERVYARANVLGIEAITVYAFSTENWARPENEQQAIFDVVENFNNNYNGNAKITYMGDIAGLPDGIETSICEVEERTSNNSGTILNIAFNYGARQDVLHAAEWCFMHGEFSAAAFERALGSSHLPPLDCIVRTAGEMRLSNFMLYEAAYAELIFLKKYWPDMTGEDVDKIVDLYSERVRKFGK